MGAVSNKVQTNKIDDVEGVFSALFTGCSMLLIQSKKTPEEPTHHFAAANHTMKPEPV